MVENSTEIRFFDGGNIAVVEDLYRGVHTVAAIERKSEFSYVRVINNGNEVLHKFKTAELREFLELDFRFTLNHDENPQNLLAFVGEIPIVFELIS